MDSKSDFPVNFTEHENLSRSDTEESDLAVALTRMS